MLKKIFCGSMLLSLSFSISAAEGLLRYESNFTVLETADRFEKVVENKPITIFARIDHQQNASTSELNLRPTQVIIFGNPTVGTPLMQCAHSVAIDLPQKVLITEDSEGKVWLSFNDPDYLKERHDIQGCDESLEKVTGVLKLLAEETLSDS